jgi:hypothetical protein
LQSFVIFSVKLIDFTKVIDTDPDRIGHLPANRAGEKLTADHIVKQRIKLTVSFLPLTTWPPVRNHKFIALRTNLGRFQRKTNHYCQYRDGDGIRNGPGSLGPNVAGWLNRQATTQSTCSKIIKMNS